MPLRFEFALVAVFTAVLAACGGFGVGAERGLAEGRTFESEQATFVLEEVTDGLEHPWGLAFLPNGDYLVTERAGRLRVVRDGELVPEPIAGLPEIYAAGQGGLLDVALDPDFEENRLVYLSYVSRKEGGASTDVARGVLEDGRLRDVEVIFRSNATGDGNNTHHFGSRLLFDRDGYLYITHGDRRVRPEAQDLGSHAGSIMRINQDGSIPPSNPFSGQEDARGAIYTYGNRNPQGLTLHPETGEVWSHEHGPRGGDEVNRVVAGANYGWPVISYGAEYMSGRQIGEGERKEGMRDPLYYWDPSIAPSGFTIYDGHAFPAWQGDFFIGALKDQLIARLEIEDGEVVGEERLLEDVIGRIRDVRTGPDGLLYVLNDESAGGLYRLRPPAG